MVAGRTEYYPESEHELNLMRAHADSAETVVELTTRLAYNMSTRRRIGCPKLRFGRAVIELPVTFV